MVSAISSKKISISWTGADCIPYFVLNINETSVTTSNTSVTYALENAVYIFGLSSFDFFGRKIYSVPASLYRFDSELKLHFIGF